MIQGRLRHGHEGKWMALPVIHKIEVNDSIRPDEGFFFLTFQRKFSIEGLVFSSLAKKDFLTGI
jgi:hypothetical protein